MVAQTATERLSAATVQNLWNLQKELAGSAPDSIQSNTTSTITIEHTTSTGAITIDVSET